MPYNIAAESFHTKKLCSTLSYFVADFLRKSAKVHFYTENGLLRFGVIFEGFKATDAVHLRLIGERVVHILLVIIELFSLGATAEARRANIECKSPFLKGWVSLAENFG